MCEGGGASRLSALPHRFGLTSPTAIHRHSHYMDHSPVSPSTRAEVCPAARLRSLRGHQKWFWPDRPLLALTFGATFSSSGEKSHCGGEALAVFAELVVTGGPGVMPFATPPLCPGSPFVLTLELKGRFFCHFVQLRDHGVAKQSTGLFDLRKTVICVKMEMRSMRVYCKCFSAIKHILI